MYGEFVMNSDPSPGGQTPSSTNALRRSARDVYDHELEEFFGKSKSSKMAGLAENLPSDEYVDDDDFETHSSNGTRKVRQTVNPRTGGPTQQPKSNRYQNRNI